MILSPNISLLRMLSILCKLKDPPIELIANLMHLKAGGMSVIFCFEPNLPRNF